MATLEDLDDMEREMKDDQNNNDKDGKDGDEDKKKDNIDANGDAVMKDAEPVKAADPVLDEIEQMSTQDINTRRRMMENDTRIMKSDYQRLTHEKQTMLDKIKDNQEKIGNNR